MSAPEPEAMRPGLGEGFNPAEADLGLQGTANSPSSTAFKSGTPNLKSNSH